MSNYNLGVIQANIEQMLVRALEDHEKAVIAYGQAVDVYADEFVKYRKAKANKVRELKAQGLSVTLIPHLATGDVSKGELLKAEGHMKKARMLSEGLIERIQGIKYLGNRLVVQENN